MTDDRPNPDALLAQVKTEEAQAQRGKLKVFFGMAAGVGKTYSMLQAARQKSIEGIDVAVGYAEPHNRPETEAILLGLEILPYRFVEYRGVRIKEFDLDAALQRRPELIVVDELAHTNAPGSRHAKRWQDIEELLQAGIDVYTTLNVQHLESLNDVVAQITGVIVRETLPDAVFDQADDLELVDLAPDDLLDRLKEGKVYVPAQAQQAMGSFFRKANLVALRELALRRAAERVNDQVQAARRAESARQTWPTTERLMVCVGPSVASARVIRAAKRFATSLRAEWIAATVETPQLQRLSDHARRQLTENLRLAERLGAEPVTLMGRGVVDELVSYARSRNVTKIVIGKPDRPWWLDLLLHSNVDQLIRKSGEIDVYVIRGIKPEAEPELVAVTRPPLDWGVYGRAAVVMLVCTAVAALMARGKMGEANLIMVYLLGVALVAARYGRMPAVVTAVLSVLAFDFFFVDPRFSFNVSDARYLPTFAVMLGIGLLIGTLTSRIREQAENSRRRERRTEALYRLSRQLAGTTGLDAVLQAATQQLVEVFGGEVALLLPEDDGQVRSRTGAPGLFALKLSERAVAQWVFDHRKAAGAGTDTLPASEGSYWPLVGSEGVIGVLGLRGRARGDRPLVTPDQEPLLEAFADQIALAVEREQLARKAQAARVQAEAERLRSSLLSAVSHDLRTPLTTISGASASLLELGAAADPAVTRELLQTIAEEAERMARLVGNLLDMTRLDSGSLSINKQWQPLEEIIGSALNRLSKQLGDRPVHTHLPADLPLVPVDGVLIEQVLINLLDNAAKYSPAGTPLEITARLVPTDDGQYEMVVEVADRGPGLPPGDEKRVFEKFYRGPNAGNRPGVGLGLPICRGIVQAHGGRIEAANRPAPDTGAIFRFALPVTGTPPVVELEPEHA